MNKDTILKCKGILLYLKCQAEIIKYDQHDKNLNVFGEYAKALGELINFVEQKQST